MPIEKVHAGMICACSIDDRLGRHLVHYGSVLNEYVIARLKQFGVQNLDIQVTSPRKATDTEITISPKAREAIRRYRQPDPPKVYLEKQIKHQITKSMELMYADTRPDTLLHASTKIADNLMHSIERNNAVVLNIMELKTSDEYTFTHSIDVATISMIVAKKLQLPPHTIQEIGTAGILHDVGKTKVPPEILNKPARLTAEEFEVMKKHSLYSYEMIKDISDLSDAIKYGVLEHHEKIDGSGYPLGVKGDEIAPYAKVLTVADIYDALCTARPYKKGYTPREAVEMLVAMADQLDINV